ncbi:hypothetical protein [Litchfieldia salsa]|uniref:Uncharacterized protein n=1 Tax=Litchfieldia salsa TaxID=930152 RepID=A0A1H0W6Y1_9BACI|nr:hypothetical protein [Litchfieldia salsa]SDP86497.1 hypothetical protein SAMN05216565_109143 [Litchfieldia salsa]
MSHGFLTPEQAILKKQREKLLFYLSLPIISIAVGLIITFVLSSL